MTADALSADHRQPERRRRLGFGVHQALEYLLAVGVTLNAVRPHQARPAPLLGAALAILTLAAVTDGPLGAARWLSRRAHAAADVLLAAALAASPLALDLGGDLAAAVVLYAAGGFLVFLAASTDYRRRAPRRTRRHPPAGSFKGAARSLGRMVGRRTGRNLP